MFTALVYTLQEWHLLALSLWHNLFILFQDKGQTSLNKAPQKSSQRGSKIKITGYAKQSIRLGKECINTYNEVQAIGLL